MSTTTAPAKTFSDFGLSAELCESLAEAGITHPFPIQELTLPLALTGADIIGQARTGTGKTLGFGLPMLQRLKLDQGLQVLIIVPTRELCLQVAEDLAQAGKRHGSKVVALYGGKAMQPQIDALDGGAHVAVGTPGRLLDLSRRGHLKLGNCSGLVLDEADEMLDMGFLPDVEALIEQCKEKRQTLLFSATMPAAIVSLARRYMRKPTFMRADVEEVNIAPKTKQYFFSCHRMDKPAVLARILQTPDRGLCVVFCRTKRMADQLAEDLRERDVPAQAIHSDLRQEARERALVKFRTGKTTVLCATEVAARGLDIDDVSHVVNYDCPDDEKMYLHRIGRTGRAGAKGVAVTFAVWNELPRLEMIRRELDIEEEIHEVFSTSPMLDEMFDLPVREEKKKVPSPPKARQGAQSRRSKRTDKDDRTEKDDEVSGSRASTRRGSRDADGEGRSASSKDRSGRSHKSRDSKDRSSSKDRDEKSSDAKSSDAKGSDATISDAKDRASTDRNATDQEKSDSGQSTRSRSRTRTRTRTRSEGSESGGSTAGRTPEGDAGAADDRDSRPQGRRTSKDRETSSRDESDERSPGRRPSAKDDRDGGGRSRRGESDRSPRRDDDSSGGSRGRSSQGQRDRAQKDGDDRSRNGKSGGGQKSRSSRDGRDGRDGRDSGRGKASQADRGRSSKRSPRREVVSSGEARGEGTPRLRRKMDVTHLP